MRIHRLSFCSIGPYAEPQELDFDALSQAGVFLFTGPTGAGKSTILDAICLALYNAPVKKRGDRSEAVVSNHADLERFPPEVEMDFSVGEHRYRIHRRLSHSSYAKRGERRLVARQGTVNLFRFQGENLIPLGNRQDEVGQQIQDIVNLSREQFTKVMMLPQGEFAEFLTASSEERRTILERLFDTGRFLRVTELLKERAKQAREQFEEQLAQKERLEEHLLSRAASTLAWAPAEEGAGFSDSIAQIQEHCSGQLTELGTAVQAAETRRNQLTEEQQRVHAEQEAVKAYRHYEARLTELEKTKPAYQTANAQLTQHHAAMKLWADVKQANTATERLATATTHRQELRTAADELFEHASWLDAPEEVAAHLQQHEQDREAIALAIAAETSAAQTRASLTEKHEAMQETKQAQLRQHSALTELAEQLADLEAKLERLPDQTNSIAALQQQCAEFGTLTPVREALVQAGQDRDTAAAEQLERQRAYLQAREGHSELLNRQFAQATLLLANQLTEGEPCAVCGSTEHPAPATVNGDDEQLVTKAQLDRAKQVEEQAAAALKAAEDKLSGDRAREQQVREQYRLKLTSFRIEGVPEQADVDVDLLAEGIDAAIEAEAGRLQAALSAATAEQEERLTALKQQTEIREQEELAKKEGERLARELEGLKATQRALQTQLTEHEDVYLPWVQRHGDLVQAREKASTKLTLLRNLQRATESLEQASVDAEQASTTLAQQLAESSFADVAQVQAARLEGAVLQETERTVSAYRREEAQLAELALNEQCQLGGQLDRSETAQVQRNEKLVGIAEETAQLNATLQEQHGRTGELKSFQRELAEGLQELQVLEDEQREELEAVTHAVHVASVADGTDNDRRISLPIYVLAAKLEKVAAEASRHLRDMTDGRYELLYDDERSGTAKAGLGLKISDSWTGQERGTRSLSGGESFMASLALALGLADVVQQESGGVSMETLFIDEGFGSLDSATLDEVMKTIQSLFDYGRVVGLVSHVEDMKNDIPTQIRIAATAQGSSATVVTG